MKTVEDIKSFMIRWNNEFPYDSWWRKKHNIAFMSPAHRECSFFHQMMEFQEDVLFDEYEQKKKNAKEEKYIPNIGQWLKKDDLDSNSHSNEITENDIEVFLEEARAIEERENAALKNK